MDRGFPFCMLAVLGKVYLRRGVFRHKKAESGVLQETFDKKGDVMRKVLVTGGTVFVSKYIAEYFVELGDDVYVLNRGNHLQPKGTTLIQADRHNLGNTLKGYAFDVILDVTAYTGEDVTALLDALEGFKDYVLISSSAVYPESLAQPFKEESHVGENKYWGAYGLGKISAEKELRKRVPAAYIFRPPYLYGPMNNVYREAFVFECAESNRTFYVPKDGAMQLQFFHVQDLCKCIEKVIESHPMQHIFNVGNDDTISIREWVEICYEVVGRKPEYEEVYSDVNARKYFSFYDYEYELDTTKQKELIKDTIPIKEGVKDCYLWYQQHKDEVNRKEYLKYIDEKLA